MKRAKNYGSGMVNSKMPTDDSTDQIFQLDDLVSDHEGIGAPACPECDELFYLDQRGECPRCGAEYEVEVRFDAE